jgi:flagellar assembly factor FliW
MLTMPERTATMIKVDTLLNGVIEVPESRILTFVAPLLGFFELRKYVIYQTQAGPLSWLQSVENRQVAFCVLNPFAAGLDPDMAISPDDVSDIGTVGAADIDVYTIVVLDKDPANVRTNLRAPILVGRGSNKAKQVVLNDPKLPIKLMLRDLLPQQR